MPAISFRPPWGGSKALTGFSRLTSHGYSAAWACHIRPLICPKQNLPLNGTGSVIIPLVEDEGSENF